MVDIFSNENGLFYKDISCIILDKDGTITDSHFYWSEIIARRSKKLIHKFKLDNSLYDLIAESMGLDISTNKLLPEGPIALKSRSEVVKKLEITLKNNNIKIAQESILNVFEEVHNEFKEDSDKFIKPIYNAFNFIKKCKKFDLKLALISSDTEINSKKALKFLNIDTYFDMVLGGDSGFGNKSDGNSAIYVNKNFKLNPNQVITIGDAPTDNQMAKNANLQGSILVATGQISLIELLKINKFSINNLSELTFVKSK